MRWIWILGLVFCLSIQFSSAQMFEGETEKYIQAYNLILSDSVLNNFYCDGSEELQLAVHPKFTHHSIDSWTNYLKNAVSEKEMKEMMKFDERKKEELDYLHDEFYTKLNLPDCPCAIVSFDIMNEDFIAAQITHFTHGVRWRTISLYQNEGHFLLFDMRSEPKLIKSEYIR